MIRGQKIELDLQSDDEPDAQSSVAAPLPPATFVGDVLERKSVAQKAPVAPKLKSSTGFPAHKKRIAPSRFQQRLQGSQFQSKAATASEVAPALPATPVELDADPPLGKAKTWEEEEKERIDQENRQKLASMSAAEIEEERRELMQSLNPALLQRLLQRSTLDSGSNEEDLTNPDHGEHAHKQASVPPKTVTFAPELDTSPAPATASMTQPVPSTNILPPSHDSMHFPRPAQPPQLDPSSATFLDDLHEKYFPSLPSDPEKLEWMQSSKGSDKPAYDPSASGLGPQDIRFSFAGELIPPRTAAEIPVTAGLHHHGDAPDAAGYTIAELAHLARSSFPAQRCISFQTLGRILYRLSKGEFGDAGEPGADLAGAEETFGELARGLWREVERLQVIQILVDESEGKGVGGGKHLSAKAYATEAVWLWQKGGGRRWKAA